MPVSGSVVGFVAERTFLQHMLREAASGEPRVVTIVGEAGIGKTTLVETFLRTVPSGAVITSGQSLPDDSRPLGPVHALIDGLLDDAWCRSVLSPEGESLVRQHDRRSDSDASDPNAPANFVRVLTQWVLDLASRRTVVVSVDDLHAASPRAAELLVNLAIAARERARRNKRCSLLFLSTYRTIRIGESPDLPQHLTRPLPVARVLELSPLSEIWVQELLRGELGVAVPGNVLDRITQMTRGVPLLVAEAARQIRQRTEHGLPLSEVLDRIELVGVDDVGRAIDERLGQLGDNEELLLSQAAVLTGSFDAAWLARVSGDRVERVADALDTAWTRRLVEGHPNYSFTHPVVRERILSRLRPSVRQRLHGNVAKALVADEARPVDPARVLHHVIEADDPTLLDLLDRYARPAVEQSFSLGLYAFAARAAEFLLDRVELSEPSDKARLHLRAGVAFMRCGNRDASGRHLNEAKVIADGVGDLHVLAESLTHLLMLQNAFASSVDVLGEARSLLEANLDLPPTLRVPLLQAVSEEASLRMDTVVGAHYAGRALEAAAASGEPTLLSAANFGAGLASLTAATPREAVGFFEATRRHAAAAGDPWRASWGLGRLPLVRILLGEHEQALHDAEQAHALASEIYSWSEASLAKSASAAIALARGRLDECEEAARDAIRLVARSQYAGSAGVAYPVLAWCAALRGDRAAAHATLDELAALGVRVAGAQRVLVERLCGGDSSSSLRADYQTGLRGLTIAIRAALVAPARSEPAEVAGVVAALRTAAANGVEFGQEAFPSVHRAIARCLAAAGEAEASVAEFALAKKSTSASGARLEFALSVLDEITMLRRQADPGEIETASAVLEEAGAAPALQMLSEATGRPRRDRSDRAVLPARVAVLITDLVGSTGVERSVGDQRWRDLQDQLESLVRGAVAERLGTVFTDRGDGVGAWFTNEIDALRCAHELHRLVADLATQTGLPLAKRMGISCGRVVSRGPDLSGITIVRATRVMDQATAGQTAIDETVDVEICHDFSFHSLGLRELKGFDEQARIFVVRE